MVLINPEVTDEALTAAIDAVSGYVTGPGPEITYIKRDTPWGRRRLAYPIQRFRDATYVLFQFLASPSDLSDIERELKLDERVIRYLLVRQEHLHVPEEDEESQEPGEEGASDESSQESTGEESTDQAEKTDGDEPEVEAEESESDDAEAEDEAEESESEESADEAEDDDETDDDENDDDEDDEPKESE